MKSEIVCQSRLYGHNDKHSWKIPLASLLQGFVSAVRELEHAKATRPHGYYSAICPFSSGGKIIQKKTYADYDPCPWPMAWARVKSPTNGQSQIQCTLPMQEPPEKLNWMAGIYVIKKQEEATPWVSNVLCNRQAIEILKYIKTGYTYSPSTHHLDDMHTKKASVWVGE